MNTNKIMLLTAMVLFAACKQKDGQKPNQKEMDEVGKTPLVIAHRGAQSVLPEHTLQGYSKAISMGADFIEPDLVLTKDGHLVARHEPFLSGTTNVADLPEFAHLKTTRNLDGKEVTDWFSVDFTLDEIKQLRAKQARAERSHGYDGQFEIPTFKEIIELARSRKTMAGNEVGIYPEIKHPLFHKKLGHSIEDSLLQVLDGFGMNSKEVPVFVQCFEVAPLQYINSKSTVRLVQLISAYDINADGSLQYEVPKGDFISAGYPYDFFEKGDKRSYEFFTTQEGMEFAATYADGIGPWKPFIISYTTDQNGEINLLPATDFVELAHKNGLVVHPYTFRNEDVNWRPSDELSEYHLFFDAGVDGIFSDYTNVAVKAVSAWKQKGSK